MELMMIENKEYEYEKNIRCAYKDEYARIVKKIIFQNIDLKGKNEDEFIEEFYANINKNTAIVQFSNETKECQTTNITLIRDKFLCIEMIEDIVSIK